MGSKSEGGWRVGRQVLRGVQEEESLKGSDSGGGEAAATTLKLLSRHGEILNQARVWRGEY
eukprot:761761-Hanusia_phi.AAC.4